MRRRRSSASLALLTRVSVGEREFRDELGAGVRSEWSDGDGIVRSSGEGWRAGRLACVGGLATGRAACCGARLAAGAGRETTGEEGCDRIAGEGGCDNRGAGGGCDRTGGAGVTSRGLGVNDNSPSRLSLL